MDVIKLDTGEILENVKITREMPVEKISNDDLAQILNQMDYKLSYTISYDEFKIQNNNLQIGKLLLDDKGKPDIKVMGFFNLLCEMMTTYSNSLTYNTNNELIKELGISRSTFSIYMKKLKEVDLIRIIKYNGCKCYALNPLYTIKGYSISAPVFIAYQDVLKPYLNKFVYEFYVRTYIHGNVIKIKSKKVKYL